jgi:hypothetical protein
MDDDTRCCLAEIHCKGYNPVAKHAYPTDQPLCPACIDAAERDTRSLVYDYLDLAQLHETSMSQAIAEKTAGSKEKQMLLVGFVEALQAEMLHVLTTWEYELRVFAHLSDPYVQAPVADWHTTISKPTPLAKVRPGAAVQQAVGIIAPRMTLLSKIPETHAYRTGCEDPAEDIAGWEAVLQIAGLHGRCKSALGRTTRTFWIPGECWSCQARPKLGEDGPLFRSEPRFEGDPMQVQCSPCRATRSYADYEHFQAHLQWPDQPSDANVRLAA